MLGRFGLRGLLGDRTWGGSGLDNLVVIIEDDGRAAEAIAYILNQERIRALTALDGMNGIALVRKHRPKVVIVDMFLPHMSGFELIDEIRDDPVLEQIFIIAVTGMATDEEDLRDMRGRADVILAKPVDDRTLIELVRRGFAAVDDEPGLRRHIGGV